MFFLIVNIRDQNLNSHIYFCQFFKSGFHAFVIIGPTQVSLTFTVKQLAVARLVLQQHDQRTIVTPMKCAASELHMLWMLIRQHFFHLLPTLLFDWCSDTGKSVHLFLRNIGPVWACLCPVLLE